MHCNSDIMKKNFRLVLMRGAKNTFCRGRGGGDILKMKVREKNYNCFLAHCSMYNNFFFLYPFIIYVLMTYVDFTSIKRK